MKVKSPVMMLFFHKFYQTKATKKKLVRRQTRRNGVRMMKKWGEGWMTGVWMTGVVMTSPMTRKFVVGER